MTLNMERLVGSGIRGSESSKKGHREAWGGRVAG